MHQGNGGSDSDSRLKGTHPIHPGSRIYHPTINRAAVTESIQAQHRPVTHDTYENLAALTLRIRDLRRLDFSINPNEELTVQVRRHVTLFSVDPLRAIITAHNVRIVVPPGADSLMNILEDYIKGSLVSYTRTFISLIIMNLMLCRLD